MFHCFEREEEVWRITCGGCMLNVNNEKSKLKKAERKVS